MSGLTLVLGGGGLLGGHTARALASRGQRVRLFDLKVPAAVAGPPGVVEVAEGNFQNPGDLARALEGVETVLHFISLTVPASSIGNVPVEVEGNLLATVRLLDLMRVQGIRRIGYPSSGGTIYCDSQRAHTEDEEPRPTCPHGLGKLLIEQTLRYYAAEHGIAFQLWRLANPFGDPARRHTVQGVIDVFLQCVLRGDPIPLRGDGSTIRDFLFIDDAVEAICALLETEAAWHQITNIGAGRGASVREAIEVVRRVVDRPVQVDPVEGYTGPAVSLLDSSKLQRLTGWRPRFSLEEGVREAWRRLQARAGTAPSRSP